MIAAALRTMYDRRVQNASGQFFVVATAREMSMLLAGARAIRDINAPTPLAIALAERLEATHAAALLLPFDEMGAFFKVVATPVELLEAYEAGALVAQIEASRV